MDYFIKFVVQIIVMGVFTFPCVYLWNNVLVHHTNVSIVDFWDMLKLQTLFMMLILRF